MHARVNRGLTNKMIKQKPTGVPATKPLAVKHTKAKKGK